MNQFDQPNGPPQGPADRSVPILAAIVVLSIFGMACVTALQLRPAGDATPSVTSLLAFLGTVLPTLLIAFRVESTNARLKDVQQFVTNGGVKQKIREALDEHQAEGPATTDTQP